MKFEDVYQALHQILIPFAGHLVVLVDEPGYLYLETKFIMKNKKPLFFGSVAVKKNYVSYYLMPVYVNPALLEGISPDLRRRMQGKSCFNFNTVNILLLKELSELTEKGFRDFQARKFIPLS